MKENEVLENNLNENAGQSLGDAFKGFPKAAYSASNQYRGYDLETLVDMMFSSESGNELSGEELEAKLNNFAYANRLRDLTNNAFKGISGPNIWSSVKVNGRSAEELWADKYSHIEDKAQKEQMYQLELLHQVFGSTSSITADVPGSEPVVVLPEGSRDALKNEVLRERSSARSRAQSESNVEEEPVFDEQPVEQEAAAGEVAAEEAVEEKDPLTADVLNSFSDEAYQRLRTTNANIGITTSPAALMTNIFDKRPVTSEIISRYSDMGLNEKLGMPYTTFVETIESTRPDAEFVRMITESGIDVDETVNTLREEVTDQDIVDRFSNMGARNNIDAVINEFYKEIDSPERRGFLSKAGVNTLDTIKVNGQTLSERYGEKYAFIQDNELKEKVMKAALMEEIVAQQQLGRRGQVPEITVDTYGLKDGSIVPVETRKISVARKVNNVEAAPQQEEAAPQQEKAEPVKEGLTPEQLEIVSVKAMDKVIQAKKVASADAAVSESTQAKWDAAKKVHELHNEFKEALENLNSVNKNALQGADTALYGKMKTALENCVKLSDPEYLMSTPKRLLEAMDTYRKEADTYYNARKGIIFGPGSKAGKIRLREAQSAAAGIPGKMDELKAIVGKIQDRNPEKSPIRFLVESAQQDARDLGINNFKVSDFPGKFDIEFIENAAKIYLKGKGKTIDTESIADLSLDSDFINVVENYPVNYEKVYDRFLTAKEYVENHYYALSKDNVLSEETRREMSYTGRVKSSQIAWDLAHNPEFMEMYEANKYTAAENWDKHVKLIGWATSHLTQKNGAEPTDDQVKELLDNKEFKAIYEKNPESYGKEWAKHEELVAWATSHLTQKNGSEPTDKEVRELLNNKVFKMIYKKDPVNYGKAWDENKAKADEMKAEYKKELDEMIYGLGDYDGGILGYVKDAYDPDEKPNPAYDAAVKELKSVKRSIKQEKERIYEERQNLKEITDPEQMKQKQEQIEKDADALEKANKSFKAKREDIVREHLLPEFLTRVAFLKATQDPKVGENVCRLMATDAPKQENAVCKSILDNIKKPENKGIVESKELTQMVVDGRIVGYVVPGAKRPEPEKKPEMNRRQTVHKSAQKAPELK